MNSKKVGTRTKSIINFENLESITIRHRDISNWLLLYCAEKTLRKANVKDKKIKRNQLDDYKKSIMPDFKYTTGFKELNLQWWCEEIKWYKRQSKNFNHEDLINILLYRLQVMFFRNHNNCFFHKLTKKGREPDSKEFSIENQKLFKRFVSQLGANTQKNFLSHGFQFQFPDWPKAVSDMISRYNEKVS